MLLLLNNLMWKNIYVSINTEKGSVVGLKQIVRTWSGPAERVPSVGVFLRDPSLYLRELQRKARETPKD